jgi:methyl-accepting chemotaxis protein
LAADIPKFAEPLGRVPELASLKPKIEAVRSGFEEYRKHFLQAADLQRKLGLTEATGLQGTLRSSVRAVESKLAGTSEGQLTIAMLMMRRHEKDFMLRDDPRYVTEMTDRAKEFAKLLEASSIKGAPLEDVRAGMAAYQRDFGAFAVAKSNLKAEMKAISDAYARIDPVVDEIASAVEKQYQAATSALQEADAATSRALWIALGLTLVIVGALAFLIGRAISKPLIALAGTMGQVSNGNLDTNVGGAERGDEIGPDGASAPGVQGCPDRQEGGRRGDGDRKRGQDAPRAPARRVDEAVRVERVGADAGVVVGRNRDGSHRSVDDLDRGSDDEPVGQCGERGRADVRQRADVAAATEELSISVREIASQVAQSSGIAARAVEKARGTDATVQALAADASKIGEVVALINNIASQTNLLALNATIEAARAGEAGRGFAVVASEVKALAGQTTKATEEISAQIASIQGATEGAVRAVREIGQIIGEMSAISSAVAAAVEEQGAATGEIARNVQQAAQGTQQVTGAILDVKHGAGETGAAAAQVLGAARELAGHSDQLGREVTSFLSGVRAA